MKMEHYFMAFSKKINENPQEMTELDKMAVIIGKETTCNFVKLCYTFLKSVIKSREMCF